MLPLLLTCPRATGSRELDIVGSLMLVRWSINRWILRRYIRAIFAPAKVMIDVDCSKSSRAIAAGLPVPCIRSIASIPHTMYLCQGRGRLGEARADPSFRSQSSQADARLFNSRTSNSHAHLQVPQPLGLLSKYLGLLYDWRQRRFLLCTSPNVYQRDPATDRLAICDWSRATGTAPSSWWVFASVIESSRCHTSRRTRHWSLCPSGLAVTGVWLRGDLAMDQQHNGRLLCCCCYGYSPRCTSHQTAAWALAPLYLADDQA